MAYKNWTAQEEILLRELVTEGKHSYLEMEKFFPGRSRNSLTSHARQYLDINNNIYKQHKYTYNKNFFKEVNSLNSYIAGYLAADGSITTPLNVNPKLRLELADLDKEQLKIIKDVIGFTGPIIPSGRERYNLSYFQITVSQDYMDDLALNFGVIPRKTYHLSPPYLKRFEDRISFLCGLLDGDGCVHISKNNNLSVSYTSASIAAVEWYKQIVAELNLPSLKVKCNNIHKIKNSNAYSLTCNGAKAVALVKVMQILKRDLKIPILDRKWDNPSLNQYILDFEKKYTKFQYSPPVLTLPI